MTSFNRSFGEQDVHLVRHIDEVFPCEIGRRLKNRYDAYGPFLISHGEIERIAAPLVVDDSFILQIAEELKRHGCYLLRLVVNSAGYCVVGLGEVREWEEIVSWKEEQSGNKIVG